MRHPRLVGVSLAVCLALAGPGFALAQAPAAALIGIVSSAGEAVMEGVLVSAARGGSTITVTVVSGAGRRFSFPADRLAPGHYSLSVGAVGYELA